MKRLRVMAADDHPMLLEGIERLLAATPDLELVGTASTGDELLARLDEHEVDIVSLDVRMPGRSGVDVVRVLAERGIPILLFTLQPLDREVQTLLHAGAGAYVSKSQPSEAYVEGLRRLARGEVISPPTPMHPPEPLSERERSVLRELARGKSPKEIAFDHGLALSTVYTHRARIREKLRVKDDRELLGAARALGLTLPDP